MRRPVAGWRRGVAIASAVAVLFALLPVLSVSARGTFRDDDGSVHEADIEALYAAGITRGCASDRFCPKDFVTREQMAAFLRRALGNSLASVVSPARFTDVPSSNQFSADISWLSATGVTRGCGADRFCPTDFVTREQMAAFLRRAFGDRVAANGSPIRFSDVPSSNQFSADISWLSATGITRGCGSDRFCPKDAVTREQMASFLVRALGLKPIPPESVPPPGGGDGGGPWFNPDPNYHNSYVLTDGDLLSGHSGWDTHRISTGAGQPRDPDLGPFPNTGTFRVFCHFSHQNFDDPIVFPGQINPTHLHSFFGNTNTIGTSTAASIAGSGRSTCQGGTADRSAYWIPSVYDMTTNKLVAPSFAAVYYQSAFGMSGNPVIDPSDIQPIPDGLMILAGSAARTPSNPAPQREGFWGCFGGQGAPTNQGPTIPTNCPSGSSVTLIVNFPQCWDGQRLTSSDQSHMAYPRFGPNPGCPSSHPVPIPRIMLQVIFPTESHGTSGWNLTSDNYPKSQAGGASLHADFVNGWDQAVMNDWLNNCVRDVKDCERGELGGGRALQFSFGPFASASEPSLAVDRTWDATLLGVSADGPLTLATEQPSSFFCGLHPGRMEVAAGFDETA